MGRPNCGGVSVIAGSCARQISACILRPDAHTPLRLGRCLAEAGVRGIQPIEAIAAASSGGCEAAAELGKHGAELAIQRIGWVNDDEPAAVEAVGVAGALEHELDAQGLGNRKRSQRGMEAGDRLQVLDGVPDDIDARGEALQASRQSRGDAVELVFLLEGGIDEDDAPALFRRQQRLERDPGVERHQLGPAVAADGLLEERQLLGVQLVGYQGVLRTHQAERDCGAAGVEAERVAHIYPAHDVQVRLQVLCHGRRQRLRVHTDEAGDAALPFAGLFRLRRGERVTAGPGMRVDDAERRFLSLHVFEHEGEHGVLQHVGEIARVVGVAVVHGASMRRNERLLSMLSQLRCSRQDRINRNSQRQQPNVECTRSFTATVIVAR